MNTLTAQQEGVSLLRCISKRLDMLGLPAIEPTSKFACTRTFGSHRRNIIERFSRAADAGFDVRPAFELNEKRVALEAARITQRWYDLNGNLPSDDLTWTNRRPDPNSLCPKRWFKKALLRRERQISDYFCHTWGGIGGNAMPVVSDAVLKSKQRQNKAAEKFAACHEFRTQIAEQSTSIPFVDIASSAARRSAKHYVRARGLEEYCTNAGLRGFFVTLTLPGKYHPNPAKGQNSWSGITPEASHDELQRLWRQVTNEARRKIGQSLWVRVEEPHADGCPHWHLLMYVHPAQEDTLRKIFSHFFGSETAAKVVRIDPEKGKGASYVMKYILPVIHAEADTQAARYQAHRATWGKRTIQFSDKPGSSTLWDEMRRIKPDSKDFHRLSGLAQQMHAAACQNEYGAFLTLMDRNVAEKSRDPAVPMNTKKKPVRIWYTPTLELGNLGGETVSARSVKVQGIVDHCNHINTHPHAWTLEKKITTHTDADYKQIVLARLGLLPKRVGELAAVMHSYPSKYRHGEKATRNTEKTAKGGYRSVTGSSKSTANTNVQTAATNSWADARGFRYSSNVHRQRPVAMGKGP